MKRSLAAFSLLALFVASDVLPQIQPAVQITQKRDGLIHGNLVIPVTVREGVERIELIINGVRFGEQRGRSVVFTVPLGEYIRRLRIRAVGYDAANQIVGEDVLIVNDPQPPFRVRLLGPAALVEKGMAELSATVTAPPSFRVDGVEFFVGEKSIGMATEPPYRAQFEMSEFPEALYATATARATNGEEAFDVFFWGSAPRESVEVTLQQIPLSVTELQGRGPLTVSDLTLLDDGDERKIESLLAAADQPLHVVVLIDSSESMLEELPLVKKAASEFARSIIPANGSVALVAFAQQRVWLTGFTKNADLIDSGLDRLIPRGQTHLYDGVIEMLYELQKMPGRRALVVLTDGVNQGGSFELDHVVHYARYAGVPIYPVVRNRVLSRFMRFGIGGFQAKRFAEIARDSGATWFIVQKPSELPGVYARIANELRNQQTLMFYSDASGMDSWHSLKLESSRKGIFRIPRGYFP
jgi:VWFA-related protein